MTRFLTDRTKQPASPAQCRWFHSLGVALSVGALLALVIGTFAADNPALHHLLHSDANQPDHQCFVRLLEHDQIITGDLGPTVLLASAGFELLSQPIPDLRSSRLDFLLPPSRAPPALVLL